MLKTVLKSILTVIAFFASAFNANAIGLGELNIFNHLGVGVHAATTGFGVELATPVTNFVTLRGGVTIMPGFHFNTEVDGNASIMSSVQTFTMDVEGNLKRTQGNVIFNVYPFATRSSFYVAAGAYFGGSDIVKISGHTDDLKGLPGNIEIGDYELPVDKDGNASGILKVNSFRPYLGLGFGRPVPSRRINFGVELGVQFMGKMTPYAGGEELMKQLTDNDDDWQKWMDKLSVYPVLKFTLSGRIF
ncbi:MAG: hypothetical protein J6A20_04730 [Muribaculaceae bacterium]|nr:hypothetical protein [Muribaculaceae bacterium]